MRPEELESEIDHLLDRAIDQQKKRVHEIAHGLDPHVTPDDLLNPQDFPVIAGDSRWNYEDGILAGWLAAQMAIRAHLRSRR